jgi:hypothetical protein
MNMTRVAISLPAGFESLEPFVPAWALAGANNRACARLASCEADRVAFFEAVKPLLNRALAHLDEKGLRQLDERENRLMLLLLSFAHVTMAVEIQRDQESAHAVGARFMTITRAPADLPTS